MSKRFAWLALPAAFFITSFASAATKSFSTASSSLPQDTEVVATSNVKSVRSAQTFQKLFPQILKLDKEAPDALAKVKKSCGIDPVNAIDDVTMGMNGNEEAAFFVALNGVTEKKLVECATKLAKEESKETLTATKTGDITELKSDKGDALYFAWLSDNVLVITTDVEEKALLEKFIGGKGALKKSKVASRLAKIKDDAAVSVAFTKDIPIDSSMNIKGGDLTLSVKSGVLDLVSTIELGSSKEAEQFVAAAKAVTSLLPLPKDAPKELEKILKSVDAKASGAEATITASAAEKDVIAVANWAVARAAGGKRPKP